MRHFLIGLVVAVAVLLIGCPSYTKEGYEQTFYPVAIANHYVDALNIAVVYSDSGEGFPIGKISAFRSGVLFIPMRHMDRGAHLRACDLAEIKCTTTMLTLKTGPRGFVLLTIEPNRDLHMFLN